MRKITVLIFFSVAFFYGRTFAQGSFWSSPDAYFGLTQPGDKPVVFAPGMLADSGYWVGSRVAFSEDGKEFFFGTNTNWQDGQHQKLKRVWFDGKNWHKPRLLFRYFGNPTFSIDGKTLFLTGRNGAIYKTYKSDTGWVAPVEFLKRSYALYNFMPTMSGHYYVGSNGTWGVNTDFNSWRFSVLAGIDTDTSIRSLGPPLNSPGFNGDFYIAPDESYIIISTRETAGFDSELFISFLKPDLQWTSPVSLGPSVNNGVAHRWGAYVSPDYKFLFYTQGTSEKNCRLYWMRFDVLLKKLKKESLIQ